MDRALKAGIQLLALLGALISPLPVSSPVRAQSFAAVSQCQYITAAPSGGLYDSPATWTSWVANANATFAANTVTTPDCANHGATITEDSTDNNHYGQVEAVATVSAAAHTYTAYAAITNGTRYVELELFSSNFSNSAYVNANTATCANGGISPTATGSYTSASAAYTQISPAWCEIALTVTTTSDTAVYLLVQMMSGVTTPYTGNGTSQIAIWGVDFR
jgi:hypothetical protein